jgi:hypothetical protein
VFLAFGGDNMSKKTILAACAGLALTLTAGSASAALTKFEQDVSDTIDRGLAYLDSVGAFKNPSNAGRAAGLHMLALLEKRKSGNQLDAPQGYVGASPEDQARLRKTAAYLMYVAKQDASSDVYRDGINMMALSSYRLTGGVDKGSPDIPDTTAYLSVKDALDSYVDRTVNGQTPTGTCAGMWGYTGNGCDSSTTQFAVAGLSAAKGVYLDATLSDPTRAAAVTAALQKTREAYERNATPGTYSDCGVLSSTERGHGYQSADQYPTRQQTSSGLWAQLVGGASAASPKVAAYAEWLTNRYVWNDDLGQLSSVYWYYMWSSFKSMQLLRDLGGAALANKVGTLDPTAAPKCALRQLSRVPSGDYAGTAPGQYFDYATRIMENQCKDSKQANYGDFGCGSEPNSYGYYAGGGAGVWADRNAYALLILQRSTAGACIDVKAPLGQCDPPDENAAPVAGGTCDVNGDGRVTNSDVFAMLPFAKARLRIGGGNAVQAAAQAGDAIAFVRKDGTEGWFASSGDNEVNIADFTRCIFKANGR